MPSRARVTIGWRRGCTVEEDAGAADDDAGAGEAGAVTVAAVGDGDAVTGAVDVDGDTVTGSAAASVGCARGGEVVVEPPDAGGDASGG